MLFPGDLSLLGVPVRHTCDSKSRRHKLTCFLPAAFFVPGGRAQADSNRRIASCKYVHILVVWNAFYQNLLI